MTRLIMKPSRYSGVRIFFILTICLLQSCGTSTQKDAGSGAETFSEAEQKILEDISIVIKDLPPASSVPNAIKETGAEYNPTLINDLNRMGSYQIDNDKAALNLGIYSADIGYLASYNKIQESLQHIEACKTLAESLGVNTAFNMETMRRFERNMSNRDSLLKLMNQTVSLTQERLESSDNLNMAALVITGGFIEGLYLAIEIVKTYPRDEVSARERDEILLPLEELILSQEQPLIDIIQMLRDIPQDDTIARMIAELSILKLLYDTDKAHIKEHEHEPDFILNEKFLHDVNAEVIRIRNEIVE